jgi:hypothetical protein
MADLMAIAAGLCPDRVAAEVPRGCVWLFDDLYAAAS